MQLRAKSSAKHCKRRMSRDIERESEEVQMRECGSLGVRTGLAQGSEAQLQGPEALGLSPSALHSQASARNTPGRSQLQKPQFMAIFMSSGIGSPQWGSQASGYSGAFSSSKRTAMDPAGAPWRTGARAHKKQTVSTSSSFQIITNRPGQLSWANEGHSSNPHVLVAEANLPSHHGPTLNPGCKPMLSPDTAVP